MLALKAKLHRRGQLLRDQATHGDTKRQLYKFECGQWWQYREVRQRQYYYPCYSPIPTAPADLWPL